MYSIINNNKMSLDNDFSLLNFQVHLKNFNQINKNLNNIPITITSKLPESFILEKADDIDDYFIIYSIQHPLTIITLLDCHNNKLPSANLFKNLLFYQNNDPDKLNYLNPLFNQLIDSEFSNKKNSVKNFNDKYNYNFDLMDRNLINNDNYDQFPLHNNELKIHENKLKNLLDKIIDDYFLSRNVFYFNWEIFDDYSYEYLINEYFPTIFGFSFIKYYHNQNNDEFSNTAIMLDPIQDEQQENQLISDNIIIDLSISLMDLKLEANVDDKYNFKNLQKNLLDFDHLTKKIYYVKNLIINNKKTIHPVYPKPKTQDEIEDSMSILKDKFYDNSGILEYIKNITTDSSFDNLHLLYSVIFSNSLSNSFDKNFVSNLEKLKVVFERDNDASNFQLAKEIIRMFELLHDKSIQISLSDDRYSIVDVSEVYNTLDMEIWKLVKHLNYWSATEARFFKEL
ncbi:uncharacterized protein ASCRUDRAFT_83308 [Ascoidea rubescens DSM 1968]|uniref:Uncharacterized protein n=1 Tax=Ascoidea rubescens DSM 1968 TaxID=1344418 RepID=A0A1D2VP16_9ASCO|nr:hypothetical protein ASCRUDRAFT_83308 [Ascoidea rubescens DSM 1968]ODV63339.1 hypothetical protein ASCRUDRAFT_83308 [Ascoidea rubescens DSM 1968]